VYDFSTLSPVDFEVLVRDLLAADQGWRLTSFGTGPDGGVDLRAGSGMNKIVVQCKHYAGSTFAQLKKSLLAERAKMANEKPARYLIATSRLLAKTQHDTLSQAMTPPLSRPEDLLHRVDLNTLLEAHPEVELRHFKLWLASSEVLSRIVNSGIWARSEALLEDIQSRVRLYVTHPGYDRASKILHAQRVVVIAGSPGVGKSMLAEMLLLTHWREDWQVVQVGSDIDEAWSALTPKGKQIFLYDDFLGQTNAGERLSKNEDARIAKFAHLVSTRTDKRFVLTTRTQVLKQAQDSHEPLRRAAFDLRTCTVRLTDYSRVSRARIIYNHLYFSTLPRKVIRDYAATGAFRTAIDHDNFSPRIIEQVLLRPHETAQQLADELHEALDRPVELWGPSFEHGLSELAPELLLTLVTFAPEGVLRTQLMDCCPVKAGSLPTNQAFKALEGTWIRLTGSGAALSVAFADPSCRDFVVAYLGGNPDEAVHVFTSTRLLQQTLLLLRYAAPATGTVRESAAHPGLSAGLTAEAGTVLQHLATLYDAAAVDAEKHGDLETALATVLQALPLLGEDASQWLEKKIIELPVITPSRRYHAVHALARLILFLSRRSAEPPDQASPLDRPAAIRALSLALANEATLEEEFDAFDLIEQDPVTAPYLHPDARPILATHIVDYVRSDLSDLTSTYQDPDDMRSRISTLTRLAEERGLLDPLEDDFDDAASTVDAYENYEPEPDDLSPVEAQRAFADDAPNPPQDQRAAENSQIEDLFRNLA